MSFGNIWSEIYAFQIRIVEDKDITAIMLPHDIWLLEIAKQKARGEKKVVWIWRSFAFFKKNVYSALNENQPETFLFIFSVSS